MQSISENSLNKTFITPLNLLEGGAAPLDLYNGHLRTNYGLNDDIPFKNLDFVPLERNSIPLAGWFQSSDHQYNPDPFVAKIQRFASGGYEVTITKIDLEKIARNMDSTRKTGKREKVVQNDNDIISSKLRAKKTLRHKIKSMGCDRLLTLTRRENDPSEFWTVEQWASNWKKFVRLCSKAGCDLVYVSVLEKHKKGNFHLHAAILGKVNINIMRGIWWSVCGGRGMGNVDIQFKQGLTDISRRQKLARYVSKYITKQDNAEFNKKRYWSSRHDLPPSIRYVLKADKIKCALAELSKILNLSIESLFEDKRVFIFPSLIGAWFNFDDDLLLPIPF